MKRLTLHIACPDAIIETVVEDPGGTPAGLALVAHPHPLHGGSLDNKVAHTLARTALACGYVAVRPNFRGAGASSGEYDHGIGETEDLVHIAEHLAPQFGYLPWTLLGFSFGSYVQHRVARRIEARQLIMVGPAVSMYDFAPPAIATTIVHGEDDELIPLAAVQEYARDHAIPLRTIAGAGHFFHGKLGELKTVVGDILQA
ncbi:MAG: alpha/beta hydrolase [Gallionellaceae bacterium]|nr:alpha/beta hydrolase [Gallionellaceae bacterium]